MKKMDILAEIKDKLAVADVNWRNMKPSEMNCRKARYNSLSRQYNRLRERLEAGEDIKTLREERSTEPSEAPSQHRRRATPIKNIEVIISDDEKEPEVAEQEEDQSESMVEEPADD